MWDYESVLGLDVGARSRLQDLMAKEDWLPGVGVPDERGVLFGGRLLLLAAIATSEAFRGGVPGEGFSILFKRMYYGLVRGVVVSLYAHGLRTDEEVDLSMAMMGFVPYVHDKKSDLPTNIAVERLVVPIGFGVSRPRYYTPARAGRRDASVMAKVLRRQRAYDAFWIPELEKSIVNENIDSRVVFRILSAWHEHICARHPWCIRFSKPLGYAVGD